MSKSAQWREKAAECRRVAGLVPPGGAPIFAALIDLALELDKMAEDAEERDTSGEGWRAHPARERREP